MRKIISKYFIIISFLFNFYEILYSQNFMDEIQNADKLINKGEINSAIEIYQNLLKSNLPEIRANRDYIIQRLIDAYIQIKNYEVAERVIKEELQKKHDFNLYIKLAEIFQQKKNFSEAEKIYFNLITSYPESNFPRQKLLKLWEKAGTIDTKIAQLKEDNSTTAQQILAEYYIMKNKYGDAILLFENLLKTSPNNLNYLNRLAEMYFYDQKYDDVIKIYNHLLKIQPNNMYIYKKIGDAYFKKTEKEKAISFWKKYANYNPQEVSAVLSLASIYWQHALYQNALEMYVLARKLKGDEFLYSNEIALLYQYLLDYEKAAYEYVKSIIKEPQNTSYIQTKILDIFQNIENKQNIIDILKKLFLSFPKYNLAQLLSSIYIENNIAEKLLELSDFLSGEEKLNLLQFSADLLVKKNQYQLSLLFYNKILSSTSEKNWRISTTLKKSNVLKKLNLYTLAIEELENLLKEYPDDFRAKEVYFYLGEIYENIDLDLAIENYKKFLDFGFSQKFNFAKIKLADCSFKKIELQNAKLQYQELIYQLQDSDKEYCIFMAALCDYYLGNFSSAQKEFLSFVENYPQSNLSNDALTKISFIKMYSDFDYNPLKLYVSGEIENIVGNTSKALYNFNNLIKFYPDYILAKEALLQIAKIYQHKGLYDEAIKKYTEILNRYSSSKSLEEVYFQLSKIYKILQDEEKANLFHNKLIENFSDSLYIK